MSGSITSQGLLNAPISYKAARVPTVNDDASKGFTVTSLFLNSATNKIYIAFSVTPGAAQWVLLNPDPAPSNPTNYIPYAIGWIIGCNFNTLTEQQFTMSPQIGARFQISSLFATNPSASAGSALGQIWTGPGRTGSQITNGSVSWNGLGGGPLTKQAIAFGSAVGTTVYTSGPYFSLSQVAGSACTADVYILGNPLNGANPS